MYRADREPYYRHLLTLYTIPSDIITAKYHNEIVYIDTDNRMIYNSSGQAVLKFRH
jgi:hypothetical protein